MNGLKMQRCTHNNVRIHNGLSSKLVIGISMILILFGVPFVSNAIYDHCVTTDIERLGGYVLSATYYEDWNEYIHKTCTESYKDSNGNTRTRTYDCSYVKYHPEYWEIKTTVGRIDITKTEYESLVSRFGNKTFLDMHRWYHTNDGDAYVTQHTSIVPVTISHEYTNPTLLDGTLFSSSRKKNIHLYEWPKISLFHDNPILGITNSEATAKLQAFNATEGANKQIRVWLLVWNNQPHSIMYDQKQYWGGGKKNELVLCLGLKDNKVMWADGFCWSPDGYSGNHDIIIGWRNYVTNKQMNLVDFIDKMIELSPKWKRKHFKEFEYIVVHRPTIYYVCIYTITFFLIGVIGFINVKDSSPMFGRSR